MNTTAITNALAASIVPTRQSSSTAWWDWYICGDTAQKLLNREFYALRGADFSILIGGFSIRYRTDSITPTWMVKPK